MTQRPASHQIEDLSRNKYSLLIPRNWVFRDKDKDYGIDAEVEIFDANNKATGLVYLVQLKATGSNSSSVIRSIDLDVSSIKYFESLELPVLIVRYSEIDDIFFCKWVHEIDFSKIKHAAKTKRINFCDADIWDQDSPDKVIKHLNKIRLIKSGNLSFPIYTNVEIKSMKFKTKVTHGSLLAGYRKALQNYPQFIKDHRDREKCLLFSKICDDELIVNLASVAKFTAHGVSHIKSEELTEKIAELTLFGLAATLVKVGQAEMAAIIFLDERLKNSFFHSKELLHFYVPILINTSKYGEIIDAVCEKMDSEDDNFLEIITTMSVLKVVDKTDQEKCEKFQKLLDKALNNNISLGNNCAIGASHYNLGNHYRSRSLMKKSIHHYLLARKFDKNYLNRHYYYEELAGVLFEIGRYRSSAMLYKIAIENGAPESVKPLYADALMFSGKFKLARDVFTEYLDSGDDSHTEWSLKHYCLEILINLTGIEAQVRRKNEAISAVDFSKVGDPSFINCLESAINLDALCSDAWFNLGIIRNKSSNFEVATFCFIMCGLINKGDVEAWINATLCCLNQANVELLYLVISTAYFFNKEDYMLVLHDELALNLNDELHNLVTNLIDGILKNYKEIELPPVARIHH